MTWTIAPAPEAEENAATLALNAAAPIHAPRMAGRARDEAEQRRGAERRRRCASGATIARPSVVLWIAKPTTRKAPSASAPTA
jgi:hypothetical protein